MPVLHPARPAFNHQASADNWLLLQQLVQEGKRLCKDFLPGEENILTKVLAGAHKGNRAAFRWAAECSCGSEADLKVRAQKLGLSHPFSTCQKKKELPRHYLGPWVCPVRAKQRIHRMEELCLWCSPERGMCAMASVRLQLGGNSVDGSLALLASWLTAISKGEEDFVLKPSAQYLAAICAFFPFFSLSKN